MDAGDRLLGEDGTIASDEHRDRHAWQYHTTRYFGTDRFYLVSQWSWRVAMMSEKTQWPDASDQSIFQWADASEQSISPWLDASEQSISQWPDAL